MVKLSAVVLAGVVSFAQVADEGVPASSNVRNAQYPRVHADGRITFRVTAKSAKQVQIQAGTPEGMGGGPFTMTSAADGVWTVTTPPAAPGFHYYWLLVDGFQANDPSSDTFFGWGRQTSGIEVPEPAGAGDYYQPKAGPRGEVRAHWYLSKVTGGWRRAFVYLPPNYSNTRDRFPVLYLQHGAGENEEGWTKQGRAGFILDTLIAEKKAVPMIVVMDHGYATKAGAVPQPPNNQIPNAFEDVLITDIVPEIDATYRTLTGRQHRALAGLSMGAGQALTIGLKYSDRFSALGAFSGGTRNLDPKAAYGGAFADATAFNQKVNVVFFSAGTVEAAAHAGLDASARALAAAGVKGVTFYSSPGTAHEWQTWRRSLKEFAPLLFRR
jgi:enterochelin esterase-like enzyme